MRTTASYFVWRTKVWALLPEDGLGPVMNATEQRIMEEYYHSGHSPEDFVKVLQARDSLSRDTGEDQLQKQDLG